jgi:hypothetical protein
MGSRWNCSGLCPMGNFGISSVVPLASTIRKVVDFHFKNHQLVLFKLALSNIMWLNHQN